MEYLKIKVNNEDESKEIQELLFEFGCYWAGRKNKDNVIEVTNGRYIFSRHGEMTYCESSEVELNGVGFSLKEITLQQLRDLVVLKRNDRKDATHYRSDGKEYFHAKSTDYFYHFQEDAWVLSTWMNYQLLPQLKPIEKKEMKEFLNPEQGYALVKCFVGETPIPESWIEVPEGAEILYFDKPYESANHFFKTVNGNSYYKYLEVGSKWMEYSNKGLNNFKEDIDKFSIVWQRNSTTLDSKDTTTQEKLKFIEKWLNGEKIQYILGIESEKTQWHNFTECAMQYIKRSDIKFREAHKYVTIDGIEFNNVESILNYVNNNFDLEDGEQYE